LTTLQRDNPDSLDLALLRADMAAVQDQPAQARKLLEQARDRAPEQARPWVALAVLDVRAGKPDEALATLNEAKKRVSEGAEQLALGQALVAYWARRGGDAAGPALSAIEKEAATLPDADRIVILRELAAAYLLLDQDQTAERLWRRVDQERKGDLQA